jgi:hypothetical protein
MPLPTITALPTPPARSDAPDIFISRADNFLGAFPGLVSDINDFSAALDAYSVPGAGTVTSITFGTGLNGGTITGSGSVSIDTTVVATLTGSQTLTNKTLTSPTLTNPAFSSFQAGGNTITAPAAACTLVGRDTTDTLSNKTLVDPVVTNYTETLYAPSAGTVFTLSLANGTVQKFTSSGNLTITLPSSVAGKSYVVIVAYGGTHTLTWAGGSTIKWVGGVAPTATSVNGKSDIFSFFCDGTNTYGFVMGQNF